MLQSYKYYARLIDARLASGYLTSRPGLYAAPRTIRVGQGFSPEALVNVLRRAGYVENGGSNVWSGTFIRQPGFIEIRPRRLGQLGQPEKIYVGFEAARITELNAAGLSLDSFTLEPEVLANDLSSKAKERNALAYSDIPAVLVHAILSIEDRRFFEHSGLDLGGLLRAVVRNVRDDHMVQGGSTITQQLVKNTYLSPERSLRRKYAEAMLALALERRLSKQDIFALYCNEVYLGQRGAVGVRGVEQAARIFFGKELKDVSLTEAATIAGTIQSPTRYSPERHGDSAQMRRNTVLTAMTRDGWITPEQAVAAANEPLRLVPRDSSSSSMAPYFIDYVNRVAESELESSGESQRLYTTIDLELQHLAEGALERQLEKLNAIYKNATAKPQASLVALDPSTGNVLAMVGGRSYAESQLNRATDAMRQPGSTFKPFVYAAALEDGLSPIQMFDDAPQTFIYDRNQQYRPANFGGTYAMREVTMRNGLVKSLNVVTVDVAMRTGLARIANLAERFGLPKPERYPSLALGVSQATPLQLAAAYATFINGGRKVQPRVITSVSEPPGTHSLSVGDDQNLQLISPTTAYMITNTLTAVVDHGTGRAAANAVRGTAIAGKTGTSRDGWFVGYTPNLVCAVWIGFDDNAQLGLTGAEAALPAWTEFIRGAVALRPELGGRTFACPEGIKFVEIDADSGLLSTLSCPHREVIAVTERLQPNLECYLHGNLPKREPVVQAIQDVGEVTVLSQHRRSTRRDAGVQSGSTITGMRVDVDAHGRRTLVNVMR